MGIKKCKISHFCLSSTAEIGQLFANMSPSVSSFKSLSLDKDELLNMI